MKFFFGNEKYCLESTGKCNIKPCPNYQEEHSKRSCKKYKKKKKKRKKIAN